MDGWYEVESKYYLSICDNIESAVESVLSVFDGDALDSEANLSDKEIKEIVLKLEEEIKEKLYALKENGDECDFDDVTVTYHCDKRDDYWDDDIYNEYRDSIKNDLLESDCF